MPIINDSTVVASAYATSSSARPQRLSNGWIMTGVLTGTQMNFYLSKDNGSTFNPLGWLTEYNGFLSMSSYGNIVYILATSIASTGINAYRIDVTTQTNVRIWSIANVDVSQTAFSGCSLTINSTGTELHASWSSKNATYPNSFNIRCAKGTIASDGSVTWGTVEQWTTVNNGSFVGNTNPCIILDKDGNPVVIYVLDASTDKRIMSRKKIGDVLQGENNVYSSPSYVQSFPSAIFVPQSINGLANGRIWVAWEGRDSINGTYENIRVSYSDDLGVTWSTMQKITTGNIVMGRPSITCNKFNKIFIVYHNGTSGGIKKISYDSSWSSITDVTTTSNSLFPSTLYDPTFNFTEPLFIYKGASKVGFYGSWTVTTISVTQEALGAKSDKNNLLTYAITTDGTMGTITESINGVVVGTKTLASGVSGIVGLSQAQWDAIKYGKYKDATGGLNTLTVTMGADTWVYTFDKRLAITDDITSAMKAVQDSQSVMLPSVKAKLGSAIRSKGGSVVDSAVLEDMASAINAITIGTIGGKKWATGTLNVTFTPTTTTASVTGLTFTPSYIIVRTTASANTFTIGVYSNLVSVQQLSGGYNVSTGRVISNIVPNTNWFSFNHYVYSGSYTDSITWIAIE